MPEKEQELVRKFEELILTLPAHELTEILGCSYSMLHRLRSQIRRGYHERSRVQYKGVITLLSRYLL
ncbi:hypothetical protein [Parageobacillus thermoglucosidasius]|uniref:hypothetical protein n=1 Tax=Parageobacillus thermoglucosidasius TaxID=1426 RepID=UPI000E138A7E|nr:hypothetical protein [Parageobacillus thermoglucosidasius]MED4904082.1 hypothetical protein [Parageobacillus thermoglucosidasius]MED4915632.1 hypothetical protein [Parageobacillus thermoglucosidasius]MED4945103.1 hypothetical protein [Parageobacillus thermoglucosidasius]MED4983700.1 hypothetical protein [Parageobacillus thermoglucosidasius]RDE19354.1 hypothetical protein DV714_20200 [Parageobacillus thermoglucosidasius]